MSKKNKTIELVTKEDISAEPVEMMMYPEGAISFCGDRYGEAYVYLYKDQVEQLRARLKETTEEKLEMWKEFCMMIDRCECSRASLRITPEEAKEMQKRNLYSFKPIEPSCTPERCFPNLYLLLHPKGTKNPQSHLLRKVKK